MEYETPCYNKQPHILLGRIMKIDEFSVENKLDIANTPEGRLYISVFLQALADLNYEVKHNKPLHTMRWFKSQNEMLDLICWILGWHRDILLKRIEAKIKTGYILPLKQKKKIPMSLKDVVKELKEDE